MAPLGQLRWAPDSSLCFHYLGAEKEEHTGLATSPLWALGFGLCVAPTHPRQAPCVQMMGRQWPECRQFRHAARGEGLAVSTEVTPTAARGRWLGVACVPQLLMGFIPPIPFETVLFK